jgi:predicted CoA-binding protein
MTEEQFYDLQPLAIFGTSSQGKGFGVAVYHDLKKAGIKSYPINPKGGFIGEQEIYPSLEKVPESVGAAVILTKAAGAQAAVEDCSRHDVEWVWLQGGSDTEEIRRLCDELQIKHMHGTCILLRKGKFPHSIHRFFHDLFKGKPQETGNQETIVRGAK